MNRSTILGATALAHVSLAVGVAAHAAATDRSAGRWPYLTLAFGVVGAAGYVLSGRSAKPKPDPDSRST